MVGVVSENRAGAHLALAEVIAKGGEIAEQIAILTRDGPEIASPALTDGQSTGFLKMFEETKPEVWRAMTASTGGDDEGEAVQVETAVFHPKPIKVFGVEMKSDLLKFREEQAPKQEKAAQEARRPESSAAAASAKISSGGANAASSARKAKDAQERTSNTLKDVQGRLTEVLDESRAL